MTNEQAKALTDQYVLGTYGRWPIAAVKGKGCFLWDGDGRRYLDFVSGIAVANQGHCHPKVVEAIQKQAEQLIHCSNLFHIPAQAVLAEKLCSLSGLAKAFFCNSGAEANEAAIKLTRKWGKLQKNGAYEIIVAEQSFHGRTMGALSATAQRKYQKHFEPLLPGFKAVKFGDITALKEAATAQTAAILLEPLQGEGGVVPAPQGYLESVRQLCEDENILLILDEVQTGFGRTGKMFAFEHYGIKPDILALAKALGSGVPIGAVLTGPKTAHIFEPGDHASTFGGNPLAAAAALAAVEVIEDGLVENCAEVGAYFLKQLEALKERYPIIRDVRGLGLLIGVELNQPAGDVVAYCRDKGLLILTAGQHTLRFLPPLIITKDHVDQALEILAGALEVYQS
jgi:acetylornithine/N-succinyldiaminopimelate aminotransferase